MISLIYNNTTRLSDIERDGNIVTDDDLETAVLISLFTNAPADADDVLPDALGPRMGFWGDAYPDVEGDITGSKLWLLRRSKTTQAVMNQAKIYAEQSLLWMVDDGIALSASAIVERQGERLAFQAQVVKPSDPAGRWVKTWAAHLEEL